MVTSGLVFSCPCLLGLFSLKGEGFISVVTQKVLSFDYSNWSVHILEELIIKIAW